jgi:hypothetical protein
MIEANFEIAFNLIDLAGAESGDLAWAGRAVGDAENALIDIERQLSYLAEPDQHPFDPLLTELKRQLGQAKDRLGSQRQV